MGLIWLIGKRLLYAVALITAVLVLNFSLLHLAPGDPADAIAGEMGGATAELLAEIRTLYGLDKPFLVQLGMYLQRAYQGDLGMSFYYNLPVVDLILQRLPATILLVFTALIFATVGGTALGVLAARKPGGFTSSMVTLLSLVGYAAPIFWTGLMLIILFGVVIPFFPISGLYNVAKMATGLSLAVDIAHHLVLPSFTLGVVYLALYSRLTRASMLEVMQTDYIRTARAKGARERTVYLRHALRNAILPVVTMAGLQFGSLISGAVLVETVFNWPGLGTLVFESVIARDYPTVLGVLFFSATLVIAANLFTDLVYRMIDPRIRLRD